MGSVSFKNVRKSYGALEVLHGIDLEIEESEFWHPCWPVRLRKIYASENACGIGRHHQWRNFDCRQGRQ